MRILIINLQQAIINGGPRALPCHGSALIEDGHEVLLLDGGDGATPPAELVQQAAAFKPSAILVGDCGSPSEHPIMTELTRGLRAELPDIRIVYCGAYASRHWREVLLQEPQIDIILRGEDA